MILGIRAARRSGSRFLNSGLFPTGNSTRNCGGCNLEADIFRAGLMPSLMFLTYGIDLSPGFF
jgi:hypothetical protein